MISYDQYENRIKKLAKFKNFMNRFKFLFIAIFALIIAALATLLALKGSLSGEIKIASSVYGDGYSDPEGVSAFWSSVTYEYAREGSDDWNGQKPVKAGKYSVRAVSNKTVGKGYGKETKFEIAPREVTFSILSDSVEYGGVPKDISCALLAGDVLNKNALLFVYDDYVATNTGVDLDESSVKIMNGTDDRSSCYTVKHEKKELDITKRSIDVSLKQYNFTYSGSAILYSATASDQTEGRLANGDIIRFGSVQLSKDGADIPGAVYAGYYEALAQEFHIYKVIEEGKEIEVTGQYDASALSVIFEIEKKSITVQTPDGEKVYDGTPLKKEDGYTVTGLVKGDSFSVVSNSSAITNAGETRNVINDEDYTITNGDNDVKDNYSVDWKYGTLTVKQREITVTSSNKSFVYNGEPQGFAEVSFQDEYFKAKATEKTFTTRTKIGKVDNVVEYVILNKSDIEENKSNFKITEKWGTLEITPRNITITIPNVSKVYDGEPLYAPLDKVDADNLAGGDKLSGDNTGWKSITDVAENVPNNSEYKIVCGVEDRTENYRITYSNPKGTLTVTPRSIKIKTQTNSFVYNSYSQSDESCTVYDYESGAQISIKDGSLKSDKVVKFTDVWDTTEVANNVCTYTVSKNYVIENIEYGTITITPRPIIVVTDDATKVYDGTPLSNHSYKDTYYINDNGVRQTGIFDDDKHDKLSKTGNPCSITNVWESGENACAFTVPTNNSGLSNYSIVGYDYGTLTITKRPITVTTPDGSWVYDGQEYSKAEADCTDEIFKVVVKGDPITIVKNKTTPSVSNHVNYVIVNGENEEVDFANFAITNLWGTLAITPRPITVTSPDASWVYDNDVHFKAEINCTDDIFTAVADTTPKTTIINFGSAKNEVNYSIIKRNAEAEEDKENFTINESWGTLTITARPIWVVTADATKIYDGNPLSNYAYVDTYYINEEGEQQTGIFDDDDHAKLLKKGNNARSITNVRESGADNVCEFVVHSNNYTIKDYVWGKLTITPRPVLIQVSDVEAVYGYEYEVYAKGKKNFKNADTCGFVEKDTVEIEVDFDLSDFTFTSDEEKLIAKGILPVRWDGDKEGGYVGAVKYKSKKFSGVDEKNYEFSYEDGTLYITRRVLLVAMADATTYYGEDLLPQEENDKTVYLAGDNGSAEAVYEYDKGSEGLLDGDKLTIIKVRYFDKMITDSETNSQTEHFVSPKPAGKYYIKPYEIWIEPVFGEIEKTKDEDNDEYNCHGNYLIRFYSSGTLTIKPRPIEFSLTQIESTRYDGKVREYVTGEEKISLPQSLTDTEKKLLKNPQGLVYGEQLNVAVKFNKPSPKDADHYTYTFDEENSFITLDDNKVEGGLENYQITCNGTYSFQILHREITIKMKDYELTYGDPRLYNTDAIENLDDIDFADNEYIVSISVAYVDCDGSVGNYIMKGSNAQILNYVENGTDGYSNVTKNYLITYEDGSLEIKRKDVRVTVYKQTVKYGEEILPNEYTISSLAYDEEIILTYDYPMLPAGKGVGEYDVKVTPVLSKGKSLGNYNITYYDEEENELEPALLGGLDVTLEKGLVIEKLPIFVSVDAQSFVYGEDIEKASVTISYMLPDGTVSNKLPYGEQLSVEIYTKKGGKEVTPKYAGTYDFEIGELSIVGKKDGLNNYDVTCADETVNGKLEIKKRPITLELQSLTITYGEAAEYKEDFEFCKLKENSTLGYDDTYSITPVFDLNGTDANRPDVDTYDIFDDTNERIIKNGEGNLKDGEYTIADSYEITVINAKLTVEPREVTLTLDQLPNLTYDGQAHNYDINNFTVGANDMADGETLVIAVKYQYAKKENGDRVDTDDIAKAGYYAYAFDLGGSFVENGGQKGIGNYTFTAESYSEYYCVISQLHIKIQINNLEDVTFGEAVSYPGGAQEYSGLLEGESLEISLSFQNKETKVVYENEPDLILPAGEYAIIPSADNDPRIYSSNDPNYADIDNYVIEYDNGALKVNKRVITITLSNLNVDYGETPVYPSDAGNYDSVTGHLGDEKILVQVNIDLPLQTVNTYEGAITYESAVIVLNGEVVTENYTVESAPSDLTINKRKIIVKTPSRKFVYDGEEHTATDYTIVYAYDETKGLAYEDTSEIVGDIPFVIDCAPAATRNEYAIVVKSGVDVSDTNYSETNYIIEYDDDNPNDDEHYGYIWVIQRVLYVETASVTKVYDGEALTSPDTIDSIKNYSMIDDKEVEGLVKGHQFVINPITFTDANSKRNDIVVDILDESGTISKKDNYDIQTSKLGMLTIERRAIYVEAPSNKKVYDGIPLYSPEGKKYILYFYPENKFSNTPISVEWIQESDSTEGILVSGHKFNVETPSITNAGEVTNNPFEGVYQGAVNRTANYEFIFEDENIELEKGVLKVTKRSVSYRFDDDYEMDYCNAAPSAKELSFTIQEQNGDEGVLNEATFDYRIKYVYEDKDQEVTRFNAGTYKMLLELGELSKDNYEFKCVQEGKLTINQVNLTMIPAKKQAYYGDCEEIKMVIKDDLECIGLVAGDTVKEAGFNRYSLKASENAVSKTVKITKSQVVIVDERGNDITSNYVIDTQVGSMTFIRRTLYVQQIVPDYIIGGSIAYTGKTHTIENNGELFHVIGESDSSKKWVIVNSHTTVNLENYDGLYGSDTVQFKSASVPKNVATYYNWLKVNVVNGSGSIVTKLYNIIFVDEENTQSSIKVLPEKVSVTFSSDLTMELLNSETYKDGVTLIGSDYFAVSSESDFFEKDYEVEAAVYKKNGNVEAIYIFIYVTKYDQDGNFKSRTDKSSIFEIEKTFDSGIDIPVKIMNIGYYPAPSEQGEESEL